MFGVGMWWREIATGCVEKAGIGGECQWLDCVDRGDQIIHASTVIQAEVRRIAGLYGGSIPKTVVAFAG